MHPQIKRLKELTEHLPSLDAIVAGRYGQRIVYDVLKGQSVGFSLDNDINAALQVNYLSAGTEFPVHVHEGWEHLFIVRGEGSYTIEEEEFPFKAGTWIRFPPGVAHTLSTTTAVVLYGITQPPCEGYPGAG